ncbi:hypothetical protein PF010_g1729 [Phytophthora fragariae]|uniref:Uncharacterized protein n=1 Tax=Phytophthora fragariae TaxID=53985 RepID=A0A6A4EJV1_9STRA|nr:hypothetical protein PF011_g1525 [Phytophthora fragariae]KAE9136312.1 hypothetical protein PF010_g1729 [Phytophthora fragariae]KAE9136421.1 hypothetical protein PF007_g2187 [Phytophthora fragariae]KAE9154209.1 hypothetical protein PF006_g1719 [Phytophthora fragariae]KAE9253050.1 hypothetical protein PF004_g1670 [Phytophthora fragariae]
MLLKQPLFLHIALLRLQINAGNLKITCVNLESLPLYCSTVLDRACTGVIYVDLYRVSHP